MSEVTRILSVLEQGDPNATAQLLPLVYEELRKLAAQKMAQEAPGQTLQPTALVHEAYLRLVGGERAVRWDSRGHFFAAAAEAMRRILVESARRKQRLRHGGAFQRVELADDLLAAEGPPDDVLAVDEALEQLAAADPRYCVPYCLPQLGLRPRLALPAPSRGGATSSRHAVVFRPVSRIFLAVPACWRRMEEWRPAPPARPRETEAP
jgi:RNA polymerase sigma factor (TIGR02999 family)